MFVRKCLAVTLLCLFGGAPHAVALGIATHEMFAHGHCHETPGNISGLHVGDHEHDHDHDYDIPQDLTDPAPPVRPRGHLASLPAVPPMVVRSAPLFSASLQTAESPVFDRGGPSLPLLLCSFLI